MSIVNEDNRSKPGPQKADHSVNAPAPCLAAALLLAGPPKVGKSFLALQEAIALTTAGEVLQVTVQHAPVLYLALEDGKRRLHKRMRTMLCGAVVPADFHFAIQWPRADQRGLELLERWLDQHPDVRCVIIDTWPKFRPRTQPAANSYDEDYAIASAVQNVALARHIAVIAVCHTRKAPAADWVETISGTYGLAGAADSLRAIRRPRTSVDGTLYVGGRDLEEREIAVRFNATRWQHLGDADQYRISSERARTLEYMRKAGRDIGPTELAAMMDENPETVKRRLIRMDHYGDVTKKARGLYRPHDLLSPVPSVPLSPSSERDNGTDGTPSARNLSKRKEP